jgi:hypothetical protein
MSSTTTKQDTITKTTGLALALVAQFMLDQRLPSPIALRRPRHVRTSDPHAAAIRVDVHEADWDTWLDAIGSDPGTDYVGTETHRDRHGRFVIVSAAGRVPSPIGEVAVLLRTSQRLELLQGGAA